MKLTIALFMVFVDISSVGATFSAWAYDGSTPYQWEEGVPNYDSFAEIHTGTNNIASLNFGDFLGTSATEPNASGYGDSGVDTNWDDDYVRGSGDPNSNGDALDGLWVQITRSGWWDIGFPADEVVVFTSQDHGPYLGEGLEYRVYGSNTLWDNDSLGSQGTLIDVYMDGWRPHDPAEDSNQNGWCSDDIAAVYELPGSYQYIKLVPWGGGSYNEPEVDAVAAVTFPGDGGDCFIATADNSIDW